MPRVLPPHVVPCAIVRKEGELAVRVKSEMQIGPLFAKRKKMPRQLRLTVTLGDRIYANSTMSDVVVHQEGNPGTPDATVSFDVTFFLATPWSLEDDNLGALQFYLEEPAGRLYHNRGTIHNSFSYYTSWAPLKAVKKEFSKVARGFAKKVGTVLQVATSASPWELRISQFEAGKKDLESYIPMCSLGVKAVDYNEDLDESKMYDSAKLEGDIDAELKDKLAEGPKPQLDEKIGTLHIKLSFRPPPGPAESRGKSTPIAAITPGVTPKIPIKCGSSKAKGNEEFECWSGHDLLEHDGFCTPIWELLQENYENDPLGPATRSSSDAPPVKRVRAIYGINLPTEVCAVYRHRKAVVIGDDMADSRYILDKKAKFPDMHDEAVTSNEWAKKNLWGYQMKDGRILETPNSAQKVPGQAKERRCCGDGTVPYWNLSQSLAWKDEVEELTVDELLEAEHRAILADKRFHVLLKQYCKVKDPRAVGMRQLHGVAKDSGRGIATLKDAINDSARFDGMSQLHGVAKDSGRGKATLKGALNDSARLEDGSEEVWC
jgi:hypothetical protein